MEENKAKTTETENLTASNGTDAGTVASEATDGNAVAMMASCTDSAVDEKSREAGDATALIGETVDVNRENARRRREAERERALKEARERAIIETLEGKNPYDGSEMKDAADVERFLEMKKEYLKREEEEACAEEKRERWFSEDRADFCRAYPDVEGFREFISAFDERAKSLAAQALANGAAGPGALGGAKRAAGDSYTAEEVRRMSPREGRENYEKIRNSMTKW